MRCNRTTRRNYTVESRIVEAAFVATDDACRRLARTALWAGWYALALSRVAVAVALSLCCLAWTWLVHADDRAALVRVPGAALAGLAWLDRCGRDLAGSAVDGLHALLRRLESREQWRGLDEVEAGRWRELGQWLLELRPQRVAVPAAPTTPETVRLAA